MKAIAGIFLISLMTVGLSPGSLCAQTDPEPIGPKPGPGPVISPLYRPEVEPGPGPGPVISPLYKSKPAPALEPRFEAPSIGGGGQPVYHWKGMPERKTDEKSEKKEGEK
jgi:hypothetical protein